MKISLFLAFLLAAASAFAADAMKSQYCDNPLHPDILAFENIRNLFTTYLREGMKGDWRRLPSHEGRPGESTLCWTLLSD